VQLEVLWGELAKRYALNLRCAYPMGCFASEAQYELFHQICAQHTDAIPTEEYTALQSGAERLQMVTSLQQKASLVRAVVEEREREIVQRKEVEEKLRRSEEFARNVVESSDDWVKLIGLDGRIEYMSPSGHRALESDNFDGYLGSLWVDLWKEEDRPRAEAALTAARSGGVGSFQGEGSTAGGTRKSWDVKITPVFGIGGEIEGLIAVSRDNTELRRTQQLAIQAEKLAAAGRMAATIAHEINNPLEAVTNFIYLARTTPGIPEPVARHLEIADRELTRVAQIAQKTLGFYRDISRNRWVEVAELVEDVNVIYERKLRNRRIVSQISIPPGLKVYGKQGEIKQALANLIANAIDATQSGGNIWVRARESRHWKSGQGPGVRITLADNGSGMSPEVQRRIFVPFFTTKVDVGTGIGLWVTKSIIEQYGGYLHFRSRQGDRSGTVMSFFVPCGASSEENEEIALTA
jgi:signal transduction histidine kinase